MSTQQPDSWIMSHNLCPVWSL